MTPHTTYPMVKYIFFSIDVASPSFGPIGLYKIENKKGMQIPRDSKFVLSFKELKYLHESVDEGMFTYYWGHMMPENREQFIIDMLELGIEVIRNQKPKK